MEISKMFHHYNALLEADDKGFTQSSSATFTDILIAMSKMKPRTQEDALALMCIGATCADVSASAMESPLTAAMNTAHRRCHFAALEFFGGFDIFSDVVTERHMDPRNQKPAIAA